MDKSSGFIEGILSSYEQITAIEPLRENYVQFELYGTKFALLFFQEDTFPLICAVDKTDNYPHISLKEYPINGKQYRTLCLFEEGMLIEYTHSPEEKIRTCIERLIALCSLIPQEVVAEYHKEFLVYWERACPKNSKYSANQYQLFLDNPDEFQWMEQQKYPFNVMRITKSDRYFNDSKKCIMTDKIPVLYLPIIEGKNIIPPLPNQPWTGREINNIISSLDYQRISDEAYETIASTSYSYKRLFVIFRLKSVCFGCMVEFKNPGTAKLTIKIESQIQEVTPVVVKRCDFGFLNEQIGNTVSNEHVVIVGAGSLGSYVATELAHAGFHKFTLIDNDEYTYENTFRHTIRCFSTEILKVNLLGFELSALHPEIEVRTISERLSVDNIDKLNIESADVIIFTVGNSDVQLRLNKAFVSRQIQIPVYYTWLEHDGETSHVVAIRDYKQGCFECIFTNDKGELTANSINIATDKPISIIRNGCGGTRVPYGNKTLLTATATLIKALQEKTANNQVFSFVNDQIVTQDFPKNKGCKCCGIQ